MAAVIKKLIVMLLSNPKTLKVIGGIVLGIIIIAIMPVLVIKGIFSGDIEVDVGRLHQIYEENMTAEERERIRQINDTMYGIENRMLKEGYDQRKVQEAQILYMLVLEEASVKDGFIDDLIGCFSSGQTDAELIQNVNRSFGLSLSAEEFSQLMKGLRSVDIITDDYYDKTTKNNLDLVKYVKRAKEAGWGYVWGTYGQILNNSVLNALLRQYPKEVGDYKEFIIQNWLGGRSADCGGLIKGYVWLNTDTNQIEYGTNGMPPLRADAIYETATEKGSIKTIPEIPGLAVWKKGHIGVYIGEGKVIEAKGTKTGVIETNLTEGTWTHWLKIPHISYIETEVINDEYT